MGENIDCKMKKILSLLGIVKRANELFLGLDLIKNELSRGKHLVLFVAADHSRNTLRSLAGFRDRGLCKIVILEGCDRSSMSQTLGINNTQVVAVKSTSGFCKKLLQLALEGGDAFE